MEYQEFLRGKQDYGSRNGFAPLFMPEFLYDFQLAIADWAINMGRCAIFADCGYASVRLGRRGVGVELKPAYFRQAVKNLASVDDAIVETPTLFDQVCNEEDSL